MKACPTPEMRLTRFGLCQYYNFQDGDKITLPGPQSSLIFYAGKNPYEFDGAPERNWILNSAYNKSDTTTGALQFVDGITFFYSQFGDKKNDVMLMSQSTTALPERLTQVSLNPHVYTYLDQNCGKKELKYFAKARILQSIIQYSKCCILIGRIR